MKEKLKFDTESLAEYLKKTLNMETDGSITKCQFTFPYDCSIFAWLLKCHVQYMFATFV